MTNTYRALDAVGAAYYSEGDFEADLSAVEEQDALASGHVEIVPRLYRKLSANYSGADVAQGETFEAALLVDHEAALIGGGHIERVDVDAMPPGNATRDDWAAYALRNGAAADDLVDDDGKPLGRDAIRDLYGPGTTNLKED